MEGAIHWRQCYKTLFAVTNLQMHKFQLKVDWANLIKKNQSIYFDWMDVTSHTMSFSQSECNNSEYKFVYEIALITLIGFCPSVGN